MNMKTTLTRLNVELLKRIGSAAASTPGFSVLAMGKEAASRGATPEISPAQRAGEGIPRGLRPEGTLETLAIGTFRFTTKSFPSTLQLPQSGYTLIELLCTIGIIGILAGLYLGVIARAFIYIMKFVNHFEGH